MRLWITGAHATTIHSPRRHKPGPRPSARIAPSHDLFPEREPARARRAHVEYRHHPLPGTPASTPSARELTPQQFLTWIQPLACRHEGNGLKLTAPNRFVLQWVKDRFGARIVSLATAAAGAPVSVEYAVADAPAPAPAPTAERPLATGARAPAAATRACG